MKQRSAPSGLHLRVSGDSLYHRSRSHSEAVLVPDNAPKTARLHTKNYVEILDFLLYFRGGDSDIDVENIFLLTFRCDVTPEELLLMLLTRFQANNDAHTRSPRLEEKRRICLLIMKWCSRYYIHDFIPRPKRMIGTLQTFLNAPAWDEWEQLFPLRKVLKNASIQYSNQIAQCPFIHYGGLVVPTSRSLGVSSVIPLQTLRAFHNYQVDKLTRQITLVDASLFRSIAPCEWLQVNPCDTPHLGQLVNWSNNITSWVVTQIVCEPDPKLRAMTISKFIEMAECAVKMGAYSTLTNIMGGLSNAAVLRLEKSNKITRFKKKKTKLEQLTKPKFLTSVALSETHSSLLMPAGHSIRTFRLVSEFHNNTYKYNGTKMINFTKLNTQWQAAQHMEMFKKLACYPGLTRDTRIWGYLKNLPVLSEESIWDQVLNAANRKKITSKKNSIKKSRSSVMLA